MSECSEVREAISRLRTKWDALGLHVVAIGYRQLLVQEYSNECEGEADGGQACDTIESRTHHEKSDEEDRGKTVLVVRL